MGFGMSKIHFLLLLLLSFACHVQAEQHFTPKTEQLINHTKTLVYNTDFLSAQEAVANYLEDKTLSVEEEFYGYFLQADITKSAGNPNLAISMLITADKLLNYLQKDKKKLYKSLLYGNIAECHFNLFEYEKAKENALKSIYYHSNNSLKNNGHAINHLILGYTHRLDGQYKKAINYYHKAVNSYKSTKNACELPLCYLKIADLYLAKNNYSKAENYIDLALVISDSCAIDQYLLLSYLGRIAFLEKQERYKDIFQLMKKVEPLQQKIHKSDQLKLVSDLQIKHQTILAQAENQKLKERAIIVNQNNSFKFILLLGSVIVLLILLLLGGLLLYIRYQKNSKLSTQLKKIHQQNKEREALLKEVHHRVKNNLQVITSLLHLQAIDDSQKQKDPARLFQSSQNRINAMALVHEMLYQSENISKILLPDYIKDLAQSLYRNLKKPHQDINFELNIPNIYLGLDTAIPLGLLLNEILSNALLHGLSEQTKGNIYVHVSVLKDNLFQLSIGDDGVGLGNCTNIFQKQGLGLSLIQKLIRQLQGSIKNTNIHPGCHYQLEFKAVD